MVSWVRVWWRDGKALAGDLQQELAKGGNVSWGRSVFVVEGVRLRQSTEMKNEEWGTYDPAKVLFAAYYRVAMDGGMRREELMRAISLLWHWPRWNLSTVLSLACSWHKTNLWISLSFYPSLRKFNLHHLPISWLNLLIISYLFLWFVS